MLIRKMSAVSAPGGGTAPLPAMGQPSVQQDSPSWEVGCPSPGTAPAEDVPEQMTSKPWLPGATPAEAPVAKPATSSCSTRT